MDQHAVPRQITTFEFKLIGFLTLKQFLYIVLFLLSGLVAYFLIPIPILNIVAAGSVSFIGIAFAFIPINDRPLDVWVRNFLKKLYTPTQFYYHKNNQSPDFLKDVYIGTTPNLIATHVDARKKLAAYMAQKNPKPKKPNETAINNEKNVVAPEDKLTKKNTITVPQTDSPNKPSVTTSSDQPFFVGYVKNAKNIPLPGVLIYIKSASGKTERILKTNSHGVFATFHNMANGEYLFEIKDNSGKYFFDTINIKINSDNPNPIIIHSKEKL